MPSESSSDKSASESSTKLTADFINTRTALGLDRIRFYTKAVAKIVLDAERETRLHQAFCLACYYLDRYISGQAFSNQPCQIAGCERESEWHNTRCPSFCANCAQKHSICRRCGADIGHRQRKSIRK